MVLGSRKIYISEFPGKRGMSVPAVHLRRVEEFTEDWNSELEPQLFSRTSRAFLDSDDIITSPNRHDFVRDFSNRVYFSSVHPPSPIIVDSSYSTPLVETTTYSVPYNSVAYNHVSRAKLPLRNFISPVRTLPSYHYPRYYSSDSRRRTIAGGLRPVVKRRTAMDDEVEAFLASSPQKRYPTYTPSFRSSSASGLGHQNSIGTPSYANQHLYRPPTWTPYSSGWNSSSYQSYSGHSGYQPSYLLTTHVASPAPPTIYAPFVTSTYRPMTYYTPRSVARSPSVARRPLSTAGSHYMSTPAIHTNISTTQAYSPKSSVPTYGSTSKLYVGDEYSPSNLRSGRSRSRFSEAMPSPQFARNPRSASVATDAPRPIVNYKDIKPPMSETRRKVRDLICKTRKDPRYYD